MSDLKDYKRHYEATYARVTLPENVGPVDKEEREHYLDAYSMPLSIVQDCGKRVWLRGDHHHLGLSTSQIAQVECKGDKFDRDGNCVISVPEEWCTFLTEDEAAGYFCDEEGEAPYA